AGASQLQISSSEQERLRFWAGRKNAFPAAGRVSPDYYCMDGTIPRRHLARVLNAIVAMEEDFGLHCANVFHAGDGNLHPLILFDANIPEQVEKAERFGAAILELCVEVGGTITGEHGVGIEKINQMCVQFTRQELNFFVALKRGFDPYGLLNPEKVIPTLARCAEYGRMHVHAGPIRFPDLPRVSGNRMEFALSEMIDQVMTARASLKNLFIRGGGTKVFFGESYPPSWQGSILD